MRQARLAVMAFFAVLGITNGDWLSRIPSIAHGLNLSDGMLGLSLLAGPAGSFAVASLAGAVIDRAGSRVPTTLAGIGVALLPISFSLAPDQAALMAGMFTFGVVAGVLDVGMNAQAVQVERDLRRPLMTSFHATYSFGALAGGLLGGAFAWAGASPAASFPVVAVPLAALAVASGRQLVPDGRRRPAVPAPHPGPVGVQPAAEGEQAAPALPGHLAVPVVPAVPGDLVLPAVPGDLVVPAVPGDPVVPAVPGDSVVPGPSIRPQLPEPAPDPHVRTSRARSTARIRRAFRPAADACGISPLLVLSLLALCSLLGEGAADGWSAVYMRDSLGTSPGFAAMGFAAFALTMASGRLVGDRLAGRFGPVALLRAGGLLAATGMAVTLLTASAPGAIAGFAVYGAGLSCTFPQLLSLAGNIRPDRPASAIARVAGLGYVGLLSGPVLIGGIASGAGLTVALCLPALLALCITAGAGRGTAVHADR